MTTPMSCPAVCAVARQAARTNAACSVAAVLYDGLLTYLAMGSLACHAGTRIGLGPFGAGADRGSPP